MFNLLSLLQLFFFSYKDSVGIRKNFFKNEKIIKINFFFFILSLLYLFFYKIFLVLGYIFIGSFNMILLFFIYTNVYIFFIIFLIFRNKINYDFFNKYKITYLYYLENYFYYFIIFFIIFYFVFFFNFFIYSVHFFECILDLFYIKSSLLFKLSIKFLFFSNFYTNLYSFIFTLLTLIKLYLIYKNDNNYLLNIIIIILLLYSFFFLDFSNLINLKVYAVGETNNDFYQININQDEIFKLKENIETKKFLNIKDVQSEFIKQAINENRNKEGIFFFNDKLKNEMGICVSEKIMFGDDFYSQLKFKDKARVNLFTQLYTYQFSNLQCFFFNSK